MTEGTDSADEKKKKPDEPKPYRLEELKKFIGDESGKKPKTGKRHDTDK